MSDAYREVTTTSWGSRLRSSLGGVLFGMIVFLGGMVLLFTNEGRAVRTAKSLGEGASAVIAVRPDVIDPDREGLLVHFSGPAEVDAPLRDPIFGVEATGLRLRRNVEMFQWIETKDSETETKVGGGTETVTTYSYAKGWSGRHHDSSGFKKPAGHENPALPYSDETWVATGVRVGAFQLPQAMISNVGSFDRLPLDEGEPGSVERPEGFRVTADGRLYRGTSPIEPVIGDLRIAHEVVPVQSLSVVARQSGTSVAPYPTKAGKPISLVRTGMVPAEEMFAAAERANTVLTWVLRLGGVLMLFVGVRMVLGPLAVLADVLPPVGAITRVGTSTVAFLIAAPVGLVVVAVAWLFYRPVLGITLLVLATGGLVWLLRSLRKKGRGVPSMAPPAEAAVPPPPPPPG